MEKKRVWLAAVCAGSLFCAAAGCAPRISEEQTVREIISRENYVNVRLGEGYYQQEVQFDMKNDRAVIPKQVEWGMYSYREGDTVGIYYGEDEGSGRYDSDRETNPELYAESYLDSIKSLNLKAADIREHHYNVKVIEKKQLELFEEELTQISGIVIKGEYELTGVKIEFDRRFRPVSKSFQLKNTDSPLVNEKKQEEKLCRQEFRYDTGKVRFDTSFGDVKKQIEKEMVY